MFRKEFVIFATLAAGVFLLVAAVGAWVGRTIKADAALISMDTLPGLVDAGAAMALTQENWMRVNQLLNAQSTNERARLVEQIRTNSNEGLWADYGQSLNGPEDRRDYLELMAARTNYMQLREQFFVLVQGGPGAEAKAFFVGRMKPAYESYRLRSKGLFEYNAAVGKERAARVIRISRAAPWILGGAGVLLFSFGLVVGLRGALTGLSWVSPAARTQPRRSRLVESKSLQLR